MRLAVTLWLLVAIASCFARRARIDSTSLHVALNEDVNSSVTALNTTIDNPKWRPEIYKRYHAEKWWKKLEAARPGLILKGLKSEDSFWRSAYIKFALGHIGWKEKSIPSLKEATQWFAGKLELYASSSENTQKGLEEFSTQVIDGAIKEIAEMNRPKKNRILTGEKFRHCGYDWPVSRLEEDSNSSPPTYQLEATVESKFNVAALTLLIVNNVLWLIDESPQNCSDIEQVLEPETPLQQELGKPLQQCLSKLLPRPTRCAPGGFLQLRDQKGSLRLQGLYWLALNFDDIRYWYRLVGVSIPECEQGLLKEPDGEGEIGARGACNNDAKPKTMTMTESGLETTVNEMCNEPDEATIKAQEKKAQAKAQAERDNRLFEECRSEVFGRQRSWTID